VSRKLTCPKCQSHMFRITLSERQETSETASQTTKMTILTLLHITCARAWLIDMSVAKFLLLWVFRLLSLQSLQQI
jgi:predicted nucleic-acid-binding Zn-ribbon protein